MTKLKVNAVSAYNVHTKKMEPIAAIQGEKGPKGDKGDPYDHSEEFSTLAAQVRADAEAVSQADVMVTNNTKIEINVVESVNGIGPDENGNVNVPTGGDVTKEYVDQEVGHVKADLSELNTEVADHETRIKTIEDDLMGGATEYEEIIEYHTLNRFDVNAIEDGLIDTSTGIVNPTTNRYTSDYIQVENLEYMRVCYWDTATSTRKNQGVYAICFFDKDKNVINGTYNTSSLQIICENVKYIRVSLSNKSNAPVTMLLIRKEPNPNATEYIPYDAEKKLVPIGGGGKSVLEKIDDLQIEIDKLKPTTTNLPKVYVFGDSISAGDYYDDQNVNPHATSWNDTLKEYRPWAWCERLEGCEVVNKSVANTGFIKANGLSQTIPSTVSLAISDGIADSDLFIFAGGINDYKSNLHLGDVNDLPNLGTDTVLGSMINCIRLLQAESPLAQFIICSPINCKAKGTETTQYSINFKNSAPTPYTLAEMAEGFKKVCEYLRITFIDMTNESAVSMLNIDTILGADNIHPSVDGILPLSRSYIGKINAVWYPTTTALEMPN